MPKLSEEITLKQRLNELINSLHTGQQLVYKDPSRIRVLNCGARWGKDRLGIIDLFSKCIGISTEKHRNALIPGVLGWYVAPTFGLLRQSWAEAEFFFNGIKGVQFKQSERQIRLPGRVLIEFKSADRPGALLGRGLDFCVITEGARLKPEAFYNNLLTRLNSPGRGPSGCGGRIMINSTPYGRNWWRDLCRLAGSSKDFKYFKYTTFDNPFINKAEIEAQKATMSTAAFKQEYLAEFLDSEGAVFPSTDNLLKEYNYPIKPENRGKYVCGIDWGRYGDSTAAVIIDITTVPFKVANVLHMTGLGYSEQIRNIKKFLSGYNNIKIVAESNSLGDPLIHQLKQEMPKASITPFFTSSASKMSIIENAVSIMDSKEILFPAKRAGTFLISSVPHLTEELELYEAKEQRSGARTFSAPAGKHDDLVMAFCFALSGRQTVSYICAVY